MTEQPGTMKREGAGERGLRFFRDFNIFVGGAALVGAVLAPPLAAGALGAYGAFNLAQGAGFEVLRRGSAKRRRRSAK